MRSRITTALAAAFLLVAPAVSHANLAVYTQDFEGLVQSSPTALSADGWLVYGNVFTPDHSGYLYGYGAFPAPNGGSGFCSIVTGQGGALQGNQQLSVYSDYNNTDHANGNLIEANVYQEQTVGAGDVGKTCLFKFDAKLGNLVAPTTAVAFIKTLDPAHGYATTNDVTIDMSSIPATWGTYTISLAIDPSLAGQILQFGFASTATHYNGSGVFYDNINFYPDQAVPTKHESWGQLKSLFH